MEEVPSNKREREGSDESLNSPEEKRLRTDLFLGIFDDDTDAGSEDGLASVMKILEEEIGLPSPLGPPPAEVPLDSADARQPDLGYLLEASDDELGLPPTVATSEEGGLEVEKACSDLQAGFGQIWGFADEMPECYDGLDLTAFRPEARESVTGEDSGVLDGELFVYSDEVYPPSDFAELFWRPESLPAV